MKKSGNRVVARVDSLVITFPGLGPGRDESLGTDGMSLELKAGEIWGLVGESGSGKSLTAQALAGLLPPSARARGLVEVLGLDMLGGAEEKRQALRGGDIGLVFQNPGASLSPWVRIGVQMAEGLTQARGWSREKAEAKVLELLPRLKLPADRAFLRRYPHELSGGMRQRVAVAAALASEPRLLIADEPSTALDVVTQMELLSLLRLSAGPKRALLLITHDLLVASRICHHIAVAYAGRIVERGPASVMLRKPHHPYSRALLAAANKEIQGKRLLSIPGGAAAPGRVPGCPFHPRCPQAKAECGRERPEMTKKGRTESACILPLLR